MDLENNATISQEMGGTAQSGAAGQRSCCCSSLILGIDLFILVSTGRNNDGLFPIGRCNGLLRNDTWGLVNNASVTFAMMR